MVLFGETNLLCLIDQLLTRHESMHILHWGNRNADVIHMCDALQDASDSSHGGSYQSTTDDDEDDEDYVVD